jgi:hypothetical protein
LYSEYPLPSKSSGLIVHSASQDSPLRSSYLEVIVVHYVNPAHLQVPVGGKEPRQSLAEHGVVLGQQHRCRTFFYRLTRIGGELELFEGHAVPPCDQN